MAYEIPKESERSFETPLTNFPVGEDAFERMMDVTIPLMALVNQYNQLYAAGNYTECNNILENNPDLKACFFNADKYNQLRDAVISIEQYLLNQVEVLYNTIAANAIGIEDNPKTGQETLVAYSAAKINSLVERLDQALDVLQNKHTIRYIDIPVSGWSTGSPCTNKVTVQGMTGDADLKVIGIYPGNGASQETISNMQKASSLLMTNDSMNAVGTDYVTFKASSKPAVNITVITEGG